MNGGSGSASAVIPFCDKETLCALHLCITSKLTSIVNDSHAV